MKKSFMYPIIFMVILTVFFTSILAFLNYSTADRIAYNQETDIRKVILYVLDIDPDSDDPETIERVFKDKIIEEKIDDDIIYLVVEDEETIAYAFPVGGTGLWGSITGYAGISADYTKLLGVDFVEQSETPGLGGRISEDIYKEQFRNLDLSKVEDENYIIYTPASGGNIDAIAGATLTSQSVANFLNKDIGDFIKKRRGE